LAFGTNTRGKKSLPHLTMLTLKRNRVNVLLLCSRRPVGGADRNQLDCKLKPTAVGGHRRARGSLQELQEHG